MTNRAKGWGRTVKLAAAPIFLAGLSACATPFQADVSRFQAQLPAPQGESYFVVADDPIGFRVRPVLDVGPAVGDQGLSGLDTEQASEHSRRAC